MKTLGKILTALALAAPAHVGAEAAPTPLDGLSSLLGTWKGGGAFSSGADVVKIGATWSCKHTAAQFGVLCTLHVTGIPGVPAYEETDLLGYEASANAYHWYSVTNAGETHDHVAAANESKLLRFSYTGTQQGKPLREVIDLDFAKRPGHVSGRAETFVAGATVSVMQLELNK